MMQTLTLDIWMQDDPQHSVLLMDESGSVGLDLSFASHVFIMEPLENASLEEQVISRAHRMGAQADVQVETLVMRVRAADSRPSTTECVYLLAVLIAVCLERLLGPFLGHGPSFLHRADECIVLQVRCAQLI